MLTENCLENPVSLKKIKNEKILEKYTLVLKDDVWKKGLLLLRHGLYISEEVVDKLINFGIEKINVHFYEDDLAEEEKYVEMLKMNFIKNQIVFIFDKNIKNSVYYANILIHTGFKRGNVYAISNFENIPKYFKSKKPDYLIIDYESNPESIATILKETSTDTNIFLLINEISKQSKSFIKFESNTRFFNINFVSKPLSLGYFLRLTTDCISSDFSELLKNEQNDSASLIRNYKYD